MGWDGKERHRKKRYGIRFATVSGRSRTLLKSMLDAAILENVEISTKVYFKEVERL